MYYLIPFLIYSAVLDSLGLGLGSKGHSKKSSSFNKECYRTFDGSYNNLEHPKWGAASTPYARFIKSSYCGKNDFPRSKDGDELLNPRQLSLLMFPDIPDDDPVMTLLPVVWGQAIAHDMSLTDGISQSDIDTLKCCSDGKYTGEKHSRCVPIKVPIEDPFNGPEGRECFDFIRTLSTASYEDRCDDCDENTKYDPISAVSMFIDLSLVYGNSKEVSDSLRTFHNGKLKTSRINHKYYPPTHNNPEDGCSLKNVSKNYCFIAGDPRINQNPPLTLVQIVLLRQHNKIAGELCDMNEHWDDEYCFQEARKIMIAMAQHITYYEFLPCLLGKETVKSKGICSADISGYVNDYDPNVDPSTLNEHATAAYRGLHSSIQGYLRLCSDLRKERKKGHEKYSCDNCIVRMSDWYGNPSLLTYLEELLGCGLFNQSMRAVDRNYDDEITKYFFRKGKLGVDLKAVDIQRSRDHGVGTYVEALKICELSYPKKFEDFGKYMSEKYVQLLQRVYKYPEDVELVVGGAIENLCEGALSGPTYNCIMAAQFRKTRLGDRFFFESGTQPCPFTLDQLNSIRKGGTISSLFCNNIDGFHYIQAKGFERVSDDNPRVKCSSLPEIDLSLWKD